MLIFPQCNFSLTCSLLYDVGLLQTFYCLLLQPLPSLRKEEDLVPPPVPKKHHAPKNNNNLSVEWHLPPFQWTLLTFCIWTLQHSMHSFLEMCLGHVQRGDVENYVFFWRNFSESAWRWSAVLMTTCSGFCMENERFLSVITTYVRIHLQLFLSCMNVHVSCF